MIHRLALFEVLPEHLPMTIQAIEEFVAAVNSNEVGCILYRPLQEVHEPSKFTHYMVFKTKEDEELHRQTELVKIFVDILYPTLPVNTVFKTMRVIGSG